MNHRLCVTNWRIGVLMIGLALGAAEAQAQAQAQTGGLARDDNQLALAREAQAVFKTYCYRCHGQDGRNEGGLNVIADLAKLVEARGVIPNQPEKSRVLKRMHDGEMPPEEDLEDLAGKGEKLPRPSPREIEVVRNWVKAGAPTGVSAAPRPFVSNEAMAQAIREDLEGLGVRDRRFARYFTLVHLANAGLNEDQLQSFRHGLSKLVNSLSWNRKIRVPTPIDQAKTILRIDLRDYLWDEEIWDGILQANPYGVYEENQTSRVINEITGCQLPYIRADWFVYAASRPPLYDVVLRLPQTVGELEAKLDVDSMANIQQDRVARAAFNDSGISRNNRLIERHESTNGAYWRSYDFSGNAEQRNLFARPLGPGDGPHDFIHDGGEIIFSLPNGLHGYLLIDGQGSKIDKGPIDIVRDAKQVDGSVVNGISCMSCHSRGLISKSDQVRELVAKTRSFPQDVTDSVMALYPVKSEMDALIKADSEAFCEAVTKTGASLGPSEPIYTLVLQFESNLNLTLAAAESGLTPADFSKLLQTIPALGQALGPLLVNSTVKRDVFVAAFPEIADARDLTVIDPSGLARRDVSRPLNAPTTLTPNPTPRPSRTPSLTPTTTNAKWIVLFRGRDPLAWNTRGAGSTVSVPIAEAPADMKYLRLRRMDNQDSIIIPLSKDRLMFAQNWSNDPSSSIRWCGTNEKHWGGCHLGIAEGRKIRGSEDEGRGKVAVQVEFVDYFVGSGFGHVAHGDPEVQAYGWRGQPIEPTDFEISVTTSASLSSAEKKALAQIVALASSSADPAPRPTRESMRQSFLSTIPQRGGVAYSANRRAMSPPIPSRTTPRITPSMPKTQASSIAERTTPRVPRALETQPWGKSSMAALVHSPFNAAGGDNFRDIAPQGAYLVGMRIQVDSRFRTTIGSVQPIYSNSKGASSWGATRGDGAGRQVMILAKTGYAVGAIRMRSGVRIDGLQLVFMKKQGDALNPDDCYVSEFVGASSGGQGIESTGKGSFIVGVEGQGRLEIRSLGLLVPK